MICKPETQSAFGISGDQHLPIFQGQTAVEWHVRGKNISNREIYLNGEWECVLYCRVYRATYGQLFLYFKYTSISFCCVSNFCNLYWHQNCLPIYVVHRGQGSKALTPALLQKLDRNIIRRSHKRHHTITGWPYDLYAVFCRVWHTS